MISIRKLFPLALGTEICGFCSSQRKLLHQAQIPRSEFVPTSRSRLHPKFYHNSPSPEAGHNRWSKIGRKKAIVDLKRSAVIQKYCSQVVNAIRVGKSSDVNVNFRLASVIDRAKDAGVSKSAIDSTIAQATAKQEGGEVIIYEGRADDGYMILIEVMTDNKNRTRPILRKCLKDQGCNMGEPGSALFNFDHKGIVRVPCSELQAAGNDPLDLAIEVGAEEVTAENEEENEPLESTEQEQTEDSERFFQFRCEPGDLKAVSDDIKARSFTISSASLEYIPKTYVELNQRKYNRALRIMAMLSEQDDVMEVYDNFVLQKEVEDYVED